MKRAVLHGTALGLVDWSIDGLPMAAGRVAGVRVLESKNGEVLLEVGSGDYRFMGR